MKIQSSFKDYYDYVAHQYGGGDPKIVYQRKPLVQSEYSFEHPNNCWKVRVPDIYPVTPTSTLLALLVIGDAYTVVAKKHMEEHWKVLSKAEHGDFVSRIYGSRDYFYAQNQEHQTGQRDFAMFKSKGALQLTRELGQPVYLVLHNGSRGFIIEPRVPVLATTGIASFIPAEQMYQELAYFMGNTMYNSPDTSPPVLADDKTKIAAHGFDLKQSFRNRK